MEIRLKETQIEWSELSKFLNIALYSQFVFSNQIFSFLMMFCSVYMAPEYAIDGLFSVKSDVFSFGIILLEILSGKKNRMSFYPDHGLNLIGHVSAKKN